MEQTKKPSKLDKKRAAEPAERPHGRYGRREIQKIDDLKWVFWKKNWFREIIEKHAIYKVFSSPEK